MVVIITVFLFACLFLGGGHRDRATGLTRCSATSRSTESRKAAKCCSRQYGIYAGRRKKREPEHGGADASPDGDAAAAASRPAIRI